MTGYQFNKYGYEYLILSNIILNIINQKEYLLESIYRY